MLWYSHPHDIPGSVGELENSDGSAEIRIDGIHADGDYRLARPILRMFCSHTKTLQTQIMSVADHGRFNHLSRTSELTLEPIREPLIG